MKKTLFTLVMCCLNCSIFAQTTLPFVSYKAVQADPVQFTPPRINQGSLYDPLGLEEMPYRARSTKQKYEAQWWTAIAVSFRVNGEVSDFEDCKIRILQDERVITIFTQETTKLISVSDETLREDKDGIIYQERKCVDGDGKRCIATFMYYPENHIFLIIEFNDISVCYAVRPD